MCSCSRRRLFSARWRKSVWVPDPIEETRGSVRYTEARKVGLVTTSCKFIMRHCSPTWQRRSYCSPVSHQQSLCRLLVVRPQLMQQKSDKYPQVEDVLVRHR